MDFNQKAPQLLQHTDYRAFLLEALNILGHGKGRINYAAFSRKAGFASRSFPRDVIVGKRRMTLAALPKFIRGLNLRGDLRIYFQTLVLLQETDLNQSGISKRELEGKLARIRASSEFKTNSNGGALFVRYRRWQEVFAALGDLQTGASLLEIEKRTCFPQSECLTLLRQMIQEGLVHYDPQNERYRALKWHFNFEGLGPDQHFKQHMKYRMSQASQALETKLSSDEYLFFNSVWSIEKRRLPEFKAELRNLLLQFVESTEKSDGDELNHILVCMGRFK